MVIVTGVKFGIKDQKLSLSFYPLDFEKADREVLPHLSVACIIINKKGEILIIRRSKDNYLFPGYYSIPAGHLDYGKTPLDQVKQEVKEEVGIEVDEVKRIFEDQFFIDNYGHFVYVYLCKLDSDPKLNISPDELDIEGSKFIQIKDLVDMINREKFTTNVRVILLRFLNEYKHI